MSFRGACVGRVFLAREPEIRIRSETMTRTSQYVDAFWVREKTGFLSFHFVHFKTFHTWRTVRYKNISLYLNYSVYRYV